MQDELTKLILSLCDVILNDENMNCRIAPNDTETYRSKAKRVQYLTLISKAKFIYTQTEGCPLGTEVVSIDGEDIGYIYKDNSHWISVYIYANGDEGDTICHSAKGARESVLTQLSMDEER